jgi:aspartokinase-like uncharacterized kinase
MLPDVRFVTTLHEVHRTVSSRQPTCVVFDPRAFLYKDEPHLPGQRLPHNWSVTSDSIAARLAESLPSDELVLLKSLEPPARELSDLAAVGFVDLHFPVAAAAAVPCRFVNLRRPDL